MKQLFDDITHSDSSNSDEDLSPTTEHENHYKLLLEPNENTSSQSDPSLITSKENPQSQSYLSVITLQNSIHYFFEPILTASASCIYTTALAGVIIFNCFLTSYACATDQDWAPDEFYDDNYLARRILAAIIFSIEFIGWFVPNYYGYYVNKFNSLLLGTGVGAVISDTLFNNANCNVRIWTNNISAFIGFIIEYHFFVHNLIPAHKRAAAIQDPQIRASANNNTSELIKKIKSVATTTGATLLVTELLYNTITNVTHAEFDWVKLLGASAGFIAQCVVLSLSSRYPNLTTTSSQVRLWLETTTYTFSALGVLFYSINTTPPVGFMIFSAAFGALLGLVQLRHKCNLSELIHRADSSPLRSIQNDGTSSTDSDSPHTSSPRNSPIELNMLSNDDSPSSSPVNSNNSSPPSPPIHSLDPENSKVKTDNKVHEELLIASAASRNSGFYANNKTDVNRSITFDTTATALTFD